MKTIGSVITCALLASTLAACANYATFQEADTLAKGTAKTGVGATITEYKTGNDAGPLKAVTVPALDLWYRRGITDRLEAHASVWIPFGASVGVKYQLLGHREKAGLALSLGLDAGALQITSTDAMGNDVKETIIDTYVPVYLGYRTGPSFAAYLSPKFILRTAYGDTGSAVSELAGGTVGVALGKKTAILLEGSVIYDLGLKAPAFQGGIGLAF
jgi:hypothetical protein